MISTAEGTKAVWAQQLSSLCLEAMVETGPEVVKENTHNPLQKTVFSPELST